MKNPNAKKKNNELKFDNLTVERQSLSKDGIGMYTVTFTIGQKKIAQTRHMTETQAKDFKPSVEVVHASGRTLGSCSFRADGGTIKGQQYSKVA